MLEKVGEIEDTIRQDKIGGKCLIRNNDIDRTVK